MGKVHLLRQQFIKKHTQVDLTKRGGKCTIRTTSGMVKNRNPKMLLEGIMFH